MLIYCANLVRDSTTRARDSASEVEVIFETPTRGAGSGDGSDDLRSGGGAGELILRPPTPADGPGVTALIAASPPLDPNSAYCNLLQCSDFADTCVVAERQGRIVGWISGYRPPSHPERFFVWQVAVDASARGEGLAGRMLDHLVARPSARGATALTTTVTEDNAASWALFTAFARRHGARLDRAPRFHRDAHFAGAHDTEWQATIAPLPAQPSN